LVIGCIVDARKTQTTTWRYTNASELQAPEREKPFGESLYEMKEWPAEKRQQ
jgi:hypothetical protein